jgi:hypothetical protein
MQVAIIGAELVGEKHALVDDRARRQGDDVKTVVAAVGLGMDAVGYDLAQDEDPAFKIVAGRHVATADKDQPVHRFDIGDQLGKAGPISASCGINMKPRA